MNASVPRPALTRAAGVATIGSGPPALIVGVAGMRRTGAAFFLGDTAFLSDARFRALARRLTVADDFNSAVGAWFIALAAARRNGRPDLDVALETDSRFVEDLRAVGLLVESGFRAEPFDAWAPQSPQQVLAGKARAASAVRSDAGRFTSGTSALDTLDERAPASTPLPSNQILSKTEGVQGEPDAFDAFYSRTGSIPGPKIKSWLNDLSERHGELAVVAKIAATPMENRQPPEYLRAIGDALALDDHRAEKAEKADELRRNEEKRRPIPIRPVEEPDISPEEADRIAREYMDQHKAGEA